MYIYITL